MSHIRLLYSQLCCIAQPAKVRLSEDNTKKKLVFFELSSESILDEVKVSKLF